MQSNEFNLYHNEVFMPKWLQDEVFKLLDFKIVTFSKHVKKNKNKNKSHTYTLREVDTKIKEIKLNKKEAFEIETKNGKVSKFCIRIQCNENEDITIVFMEKEDTLFVKTAWKNSHDDIHYTLDKTKYNEN